MMDMTTNRGVYFLANDKVYEPTVAFLNSFRMHNDKINLCLIPYDDKSDKIIALRNQYNFSIYDKSDVLHSCDRISEQFHNKTLGAYRKFAIWEGIFEEFAYIDIDTLVLSNIDFAFKNLEHADIFTSHSNLEHEREWVWKDTIFDAGDLTQDQINYAANTGFIVSRRHTLNLDYAFSRLPDALKLKNHMTLFCMEQPFLNYLIVTSNKTYSSLSELLRKDISRDVKLEIWAGLIGADTEGGKFFVKSKAPIFLLHWAGPWLGADFDAFDQMPYSEIWRYYRNIVVI